MIEKLPKNFNTKEFVEAWNVTFPFDYIWRKKYNIPFNSEVHRNMDFFDIKFDVTEDEMYRKLLEKHKKKEKEIEDIESSDQLLKPIEKRTAYKTKKLVGKELDKAFDDLDLDNLDKIII